MTVMTGAQALVHALEELGVTDVFGMPGGAILPSMIRCMHRRKSVTS